MISASMVSCAWLNEEEDSAEEASQENASSEEAANNEEKENKASDTQHQDTPVSSSTKEPSPAIQSSTTIDNHYGIFSLDV